MLPQEEQEFLDFIFQKSSVRLLRGVSKSPEFIFDRNALKDELRFQQVFIWDSSLSDFANSIKRGEYQKYDEQTGTYIKTGEVFYTFDRSDSSVIEYKRSFFRDDGLLTQGRIWADMYRIEDGQLALKEPEFIEWYDEIANWLCRHFKRDKQLDAYVSQGAMEWNQQGGEFHRY